MFRVDALEQLSRPVGHNEPSLSEFFPRTHVVPRRVE
jgi:hypothetical protein